MLPKVRRTYALLIALLTIGPPVSAQTPASLVQVSELAPADRFATLTYANRPIVELRAQVLGRMPAERAASAVRALDGLVARGVTSPVSTQTVGDALAIVVGGEAVFAIVPADVDVLAGATPGGTASEAASRLGVALAEAAELRAPASLLRSAVKAVAVTVILCLVLWLLLRLDRAAKGRLTAAVDRYTSRTWGEQAIRVTRLLVVVRRTASVAVAAIAIAITYLWLAFVLRCFPYTRPWGESLRSLLIDRLASMGAGVVDAVPNLFSLVVIVIAARWASRAVRHLFAAVQAGRLSIPGVYPDTATPTRRLVIALVWLFALAFAYPYIPGSGSAGFQGVSLFIGVIVSLGSTGVVQQLMSGLMLTFARAIHVGDYARIGDVEGTVVQVGALATKIVTPVGEEVTIPNAVVVSQTLVNYSTGSNANPAFLSTSVTIGYDTPWRQVEALLLSAAMDTPGASRSRAPVVWRVSLDDYYVKYMLLVTPEDPRRRAEVLDRLHARILDAFNESGVQIMSPHYMSDPAALKVVPPSRWHVAPARAGRAPSESEAPVSVRS